MKPIPSRGRGVIGSVPRPCQAGALRRPLDLAPLRPQRGATPGGDVLSGGPVAEWSGTGLQNLLRRFNSAPDLQRWKELRGAYKGRRQCYTPRPLLIRRGAAVAQRTVNP